MSFLKEVRQELGRLKPILSEKYFVSEIGLFGSIVRNDFGEESDIDIIVAFNRPVGIEFIELADFLESNFDRKVDLVSKGGLKSNFLKEIEAEIQYV